MRLEIEFKRNPKIVMLISIHNAFDSTGRRVLHIFTLSNQEHTDGQLLKSHVSTSPPHMYMRTPLSMMYYLSL